jgi:hypothetical protein
MNPSDRVRLVVCKYSLFATQLVKDIIYVMVLVELAAL